VSFTKAQSAAIFDRHALALDAGTQRHCKLRHLNLKRPATNPPFLIKTSLRGVLVAAKFL